MAVFKGDEYVRTINGIEELLVVKSFRVRVSDSYVIGTYFSKIAEGEDVDSFEECVESEVYIPTELFNVKNGLFKRYVESVPLKINLDGGIVRTNINGDSSCRVINNGCLDHSKR